MRHVLMLMGLLLSLTACQEEEEKKKIYEIYSGPVVKAYDVETRYSEDAKVKVLVKAPVQSQFKDGNREFPQGIEVIHYDSVGGESSKLTADYAKFVREHNIYTAIGNVVIENLEKQETMKTEELHWAKLQERIYTDKFVQIRTGNEILTGTGLTAKDDFSEYEILKPEGQFSVEDGKDLDF